MPGKSLRAVFERHMASQACQERDYRTMHSKPKSRSFIESFSRSWQQAPKLLRQVSGYAPKCPDGRKQSLTSRIALGRHDIDSAIAVQGSALHAARLNTISPLCHVSAALQTLNGLLAGCPAAFSHLAREEERTVTNTSLPLKP